jgi:aspartyl-tRNA(Asn)/glutamyl-tRNA(Gln) amidotransferase subunit A
LAVVASAGRLYIRAPFAPPARDCAILLGAIAGADPNDSTCAPHPVADYEAALTGELRGLRVGVPSEYFIEGTQAGVDAAVREAIAIMRDSGAEIVEISLPHTKYALPVYYIIAPAEASSNLARYDGVRYGLREPGETYWDELEKTRGAGFGPEVRRRIMLGTYALSAGYYDAYYKRAQQVRTLIRRDFQQAFEQADILAAPTAPTVAFKLGEKTDDPLAMYLEDVCTLPINLAGVPGLVVPAGFSAAGTEAAPLLPVGLQLIGRPFDEATLLRAGDAYQRVTDWHTRRPALVSETQNEE